MQYAWKFHKLSFLHHTFVTTVDSRATLQENAHLNRVVRAEVNTHINSLNFVIYNIHTCVVNQLVIPVNYVSLNYGDFLRLPQKDINWFEKLTPAPPHRALPRARLCLC